MKRLLLLLAALPAVADDPKVEAGKQIALLWEARKKTDDSAAPARAGAAAIRSLYADILNPAALNFRFPENSSEEVRARAIQGLRRRIEAWGAKSARVVTHGGTAVVVLLNEEDEKAVGEDRMTLGEPTPLAFRLEATEAQRAEWKETGILPEGTRVFDGEDGKFLAAGVAALDSAAIEAAEGGQDASGLPEIRIRLREDRVADMERLSVAHIGERLAICHGGRVLMAPIIMSKFGRDVRITGRFESAFCDRLAATFRAGVLPCALEEIGCSSAAPGAGGWEAEPGVGFLDRMLANPLCHAILEDLLKGRHPEAYDGLLRELAEREGK